MKKVFKSRISILLTVIVWPSLVIPYIFIGKMFFIDHNYESLPPFLILTFCILLVGAIWTGIHYVVDDKKLIIKMHWIINASVEISDITRIESSYCMLSAPANSLRRLQCKLKKGSKYPLILISPENEDEFVELMLKINPSIETQIKPKGANVWDWDF